MSGLTKDILACADGGNIDCHLLGIWEKGSSSVSVANTEIELCTGAASDIILSFDSPRKVLGYTFWDSEEDDNAFGWKLDGEQDFTMVDIPDAGNSKSTGYQSVAGNLESPPSNVKEASGLVSKSKEVLIHSKVNDRYLKWNF